MTRQSRETLRQEAKDKGITLKKAKVLTEDPFFVGNEEDYQYAQWAATAWDEMMAQRQQMIHLRGFHYWLQSRHYAWPDGRLYTQQVDPFDDWTSLLWACKIARYLGIGSWEKLVDFKHPEPEDNDQYFLQSGLWETGELNTEELSSGLIESMLSSIRSKTPYYTEEGYQTYHLEVWVEKESMGVFLKPVIQRMRGAYQALVGQASVEKVNLCYQRCIRAARAGKKVRIFYISDWDRYGWQMPTAVARKLEFYAKQNGNNSELDIKLKHLALNEEQVNQYSLPPAPKHGEMVVELDALEAIHPGALATIVRSALRPYYDAEKPRTVRQENYRIEERVSEMLEGLRQPLTEAISEVTENEQIANLNLQDAVDPDFKCPEPDHEIDDDEEDWLLDTNLSYWEQWQSYQDHKARRGKRAA